MAIFSFYRCELCGEELFKEDYFCEKCLEELQIFLRLDRTEEEGYYVYSLFFYKGLVRDLIRKWKFYSSSYMIHPMSYLLYRFITENQIFLEALSYIPMHRKKRLTRGFDPMEDLAKELGRRLEVDSLSLLERARPTKPLYKLQSHQRREELRGCFRVVEKPRSGVLAIVDDIYTTGATTREAGSTLFQAGYQDFFFLIIAK